MNGNHSAVKDSAEQKVIEDSLFHKNATPLQPNTSRPFMKPTALSKRRLTSTINGQQAQFDVRQEIQRKQSERRESNLQQQEKAISALALSPRARSRQLKMSPRRVATAPNCRDIGQGSDGKIYAGLDPFRPNTPRGDDHLGRLVHPSHATQSPGLPPLTSPPPPIIEGGETEETARPGMKTPPSMTSRTATFPLSRVRPPHFGPFWPDSANFQRVQQSKYQQESISPAGRPARRMQRKSHPSSGSSCRLLPPQKTSDWQSPLGDLSDLSVLTDFVSVSRTSAVQYWNNQENQALANLSKKNIIRTATISRAGGGRRRHTNTSALSF